MVGGSVGNPDTERTEVQLIRTAEGGFPWPSTAALLYPISAAIQIATATPAGLADVVGYGLSNLGYLLFAAGICRGSFRILGLNTRGRVLGAAVASFLMGALLSNVGKLTGRGVTGLVAVLLIVTAGCYGVLQSYRQDLDRLPRVLSLLLAMPALIVISHVFPVIGIPVLWSIAIVNWCLLLYIGRARPGSSAVEDPQGVGHAVAGPTEHLNASAPKPEPALQAPLTQQEDVTCDYRGEDDPLNECQESESDVQEPTFQDLLEERLSTLDIAPYSLEEAEALREMPEFNLIWPPTEQHPDTAVTVEGGRVRREAALPGSGEVQPAGSSEAANRGEEKEREQAGELVMRDGKLMWVQITHYRPGFELDPEPREPLPIKERRD